MEAVYKCDFCKTVYNNKEDCLECEKFCGEKATHKKELDEAYKRYCELAQEYDTKFSNRPKVSTAKSVGKKFYVNDIEVPKEEYVKFLKNFW